MEKTVEKQMTDILRKTFDELNAISPIRVTEVRIAVECETCGRIWARGVTREFGLAPDFHKCRICSNGH